MYNSEYDAFSIESSLKRKRPEVANSQLRHGMLSLSIRQRATDTETYSYTLECDAKEVAGIRKLAGVAEGESGRKE